MDCKGECFLRASGGSVPPPLLNKKGLVFYTATHPILETRCRISRRSEVMQVVEANYFSSKNKTAKLSAEHKEKIILPGYADDRNRTFPIGEFLRHPSGMESMLNTVHPFTSLLMLWRDAMLCCLCPLSVMDVKIVSTLPKPEATMILDLSPRSVNVRCTLQKIEFLNFEVSPVLDLRVVQTSNDCTVEMLSCKFKGSDALEQQSNLFSAFMRNHITWDSNGPEPSLDVDVKLNVTLQVYTLPFNLLPISMVEVPGNLVMQGLIGRLVPLLGQQLLEDYHNWVEEQLKFAS